MKFTTRRSQRAFVYPSARGLQIRCARGPALFPGLLILLAVCATGSVASAQLTTQNISLSPGWNAVYMEVQPEQRACDAVFRGLPVESVWMWSPKTTTHQFVDDPAQLAPDHPDWLVYFPSPAEEAPLTTLMSVLGGRPYLVKVRGALPAILTVKGQPALQSVKWQGDSFNFVGFSVAEDQGPTFQEFFAPSSAHTGQAMYRLSTQGRWVRIATPATTRLEHNKAYWVFCEGPSTYQGPVHVYVDQGRSVNFSDILVESHLHIKNETTSSKNITLQLNDSENPDTADFPERAGGVALSWWKKDYDGGDVGWRNLDSAVTVSVAAGATETVRLAVRRADFPAYTPANPDADATYQSLLSVSDGVGFAMVAPVTARGLQTTADKADGVPMRAGLWVGNVTVNKVSEHVPGAVNPEPQPTASEFQFKVLLHVDSTGAVRLLQQVTQLWKPGTLIADPDNPGMEIMDTPGEYVLFTDYEKINTYLDANKIEGAVLRDGAPVGRRISTSVFSFSEPLLLAGAFPTPETPVSSVTGTVTLDYDDPLNPFKHRYHPDHNNLREDYATPLDEGIESWTIDRHLAFDFTETDPEFPEGAQSGWGDSEIGGIYTETLEGLHRDAITTQGSFRIRRVSNVAELDPDL